VSLKVTDNDDATEEVSHQVTATAPSDVIELGVRAYKVKGVKSADLTWIGATSTNVDVYRTSALVTTTPNDGAYTDKPPKTVTSATYKVCEAGTSSCSNEVTVTW
jgi:hypothetical protein